MQKDKLQQFFLFTIVILILLAFAYQLSGYQIISLAIFFLILLKFIFDLGSDISIKNIIVLLMVLQWLVGPVLGYIYDLNIDKSYQMKVSQPVYFGYVLPATLAFMFGLYIRFGHHHYKPNFTTKTDYYQKGLILILMGFIFEYLPGTGFLGYLLAGLKYVGVFYMVLSKNPRRIYWILLVFGYLFLVRSLGSGFFHELLLWSCFLLILVFYFNRKSLLFRFALIFAGFFFVFILQLIKPEYRVEIGNNIEQSKYTLFINLFTSKLSGEQPLFSNEAIANNVVRLNEGWIISNVLDYIPTKQPFANGESVKDAIIASIFPRFMFPDKAVAGGHSNMEKYAGIYLNEGTSMDISQVGEAYANFGVNGGILMMFIMGLIFNGVITFVEKKCLKHPELILWIPLLFLQVIKAETSLVTVLNHLVKASLVTWFFFSPWGSMLLSYRFRWRIGIRTFTIGTVNPSFIGVRERNLSGKKRKIKIKRYRVEKD
jgi:hypothetical protein